MLNELYSLAKVLEQANITLENWHPRFKELSKNSKSIYKITISSKHDDNAIQNIMPLSHENIQGLRKFSTSNGIDFPCFNMNPLVVHDAKSFEREFCRRNGTENVDSMPDKVVTQHFIGLLGTTPLTSEYILSWRERLPTSKIGTLNTALDNCIHKSAQELKAALPTEVGPGRSVVALIERLAQVSVEHFTMDMMRYLCAHLQIYPHQWERFKALVVSPKDVSGTSERAGTSLIVLEYDAHKHDTTFGPVAHAKAHRKINELLMMHEGRTTNDTHEGKRASSNENNARDAYAASAAKADDLLWQVNLPVLGGVTGRSMVKENACQYRYGAIKSESFCIGSKSRKMTKSALEWLSKPENQHKTWGVLDPRELLFAYPSQIGDVPAGCVAVFGESTPEDEEQDFKTVASHVFDVLHKLQTDLSRLHIHIFALRKMDPARTKVVFNRKIDAANLERKVNDWKTAVNNIPPMQFKAWGAEKGQFISVIPATPKPFHLSQCLTRIWGQGGKVNGYAAASGRTVGIEILLMDTDAGGITRNTFHLFLQRGFNYFAALGDATHKNLVLKTEDLENNLKYMPSILGLLLHKLGHNKEDYMKSVPFLLGKLLALADQLHVLYSQEVRKELPSQLVGNALLSTASETPARSLDILCQRIPPYINWAKVYQGEKVGLAVSLRKKMGEVSNELAQLELPNRLNEKEKASLLLGYLASTSKQAE